MKFIVDDNTKYKPKDTQIASQFLEESPVKSD